MNESLLDDVNSLLDGDFGDDRILKQIARACKNNEVISNYERNYVQKLAEQYLGKTPKITPSETPEIISSIQTQTLRSQSYTKSNFRLNNPKLILGLGGIASVIIIAAFISFSDNTNSFSDNTNSFSDDTKSDIKLQLSVQTDLSSYGQNDLISISGVSSNSKLVNLSIKNPNNDLVWAEQISVKNSGKYSTLVISGGNGWDVAGIYTIQTDNGSTTKSIKFSLTS
jgi:hypothetical protein